ncbi:ligase-associated DNA damage response DEXH box helicase [Planctomicrobium sp. SH661]|uniref:ligase-associated DNA damage response DEXH box helicase n=1 Tax=Planctomicrobium sp. SH661 TaxID=3448124 RepID=UPI003F5C9278
MSTLASSSKPLPRKISQRGWAIAKQQINSWFKQRNWKPFPFQKQCWSAMSRGESGLVHATTGTGKTYAVWMGVLAHWLAEQATGGPRQRTTSPPCRVVWITPLRALVADTQQALQRPLSDLQIDWTMETRTSDTSTSTRNRQRTRLPTALLTTPESLSLFLSRKESRAQFDGLTHVIVDEWHELLGTKRGVQTELALARLRRWNPQLQIWGLSATLGNLDLAMESLLGNQLTEGKHCLIEGRQHKKLAIDSIIPETMERFPWSGHLGLRLIKDVVEQIDQVASSLIFTNTRSHCESWYHAILRQRPDWAGRMALHHGSLDGETRSWVEQGLRKGSLKCVVCTSSLDLGVDFSPVERVFQIGSPKGVARLLQRAGRSGHSPGLLSRITCVPTNALELVEFAATRDAVIAGHLESRMPPSGPLDVLSQHVVTLAMGEGFDPDELFEEVRSTWSYRFLNAEEWDWVLDYVTTGGAALQAYPDYHKVRIDHDGRFHLDNQRLARQHRMSIGTIVSETSMTVQFLKGPRIGTVEESFVAKLQPGDQFLFGGRVVDVVLIEDSRVYVRLAKSNSGARIPRWMGGRMPLSSELSSAIRHRLDAASRGEFEGPEMQAVESLLRLQSHWSAVPQLDQLLIERVTSREGSHLYFYPFAGRLVHEGLATLFAYRLARRNANTFSISANDYGFELLSSSPAQVEEAVNEGLFSTDNLVDDIFHSMNAVEMAKRQFREIAHISGLVFGGYPHQRKSARQLQASTGLIYDVFKNYDPENLLLKQAEREVMERQLEQTRLIATLNSMQTQEIVWRTLPRFSPFSFPLMVDRLRERLSSEKLSDRVRRIQEQLEKVAKAQDRNV